MKQFNAQILANKKIAQDLFEMELSWGEGQLPPAPGQFVTIRVSSDTVPLLRRPFAVAGYDLGKNSFSIIYKRIGRGTELLVGRQIGDVIDVIGPLGNAFPQLTDTLPSMLIAGGTGLGPILFLGSQLAALGKPVQVLYGCRTDSFIPDSHLFTSLQPFITTDDGSVGHKGTTIDYMRSLAPNGWKGTTLYACGPSVMLSACHQFAVEQSLDCWVSIEQIMACGVGACMGCVIKMVKEPVLRRVCVDGPIFDSRDVAWN